MPPGIRCLLDAESGDNTIGIVCHNTVVRFAIGIDKTEVIRIVRIGRTFPPIARLSPKALHTYRIVGYIGEELVRGAFILVDLSISDTDIKIPLMVISAHLIV